MEINFIINCKFWSFLFFFGGDGGGIKLRFLNECGKLETLD